MEILASTLSILDIFGDKPWHLNGGLFSPQLPLRILRCIQYVSRHAPLRAVFAQPSFDLSEPLDKCTLCYGSLRKLSSRAVILCVASYLSDIHFLSSSQEQLSFHRSTTSASQPFSPFPVFQLTS